MIIHFLFMLKVNRSSSIKHTFNEAKNKTKNLSPLTNCLLLVSSSSGISEHRPQLILTTFPICWNRAFLITIPSVSHR